MCVFLHHQELELYKPELLTKPAVLALNKTDLAGSEAMVAEVKEQIANLDGKVKARLKFTCKSRYNLRHLGCCMFEFTHF